MTLRQILTDRTGPEQARKILADAYPEGTIRKELERRKKQAAGQQGVSEEGSRSQIEIIAHEILQKYIKALREL